MELPKSESINHSMTLRKLLLLYIPEFMGAEPGIN